VGESDAGYTATLADWELMRNHDVAGLSDAELDCARRELAASLALARPDSPVRVPILARIAAIDAELTCRGVRMCGCGLATDDAAMMDGHLFEQPEHQERDLSRYGRSAACPGA
jgi:hypothetical protein